MPPASFRDDQPGQAQEMCVLHLEEKTMLKKKFSLMHYAS